jgi:hypothetical protein
LNSRGEAVPFAFAPEPDPVKEAPVTAPLPQFAITSRPGTAATGARLDVSVRTRADGTLVMVQERGKAPAAAPRPVAYLLDASQLKAPTAALRFDWEVGPGSEIVKVTVEGSDDLRDWRTLASRAPLLRVEQAGQSLSQTRVELKGTQSKYFRITWDGTPFILKSVQAESVPEVKQKARLVTKHKGVATKDGESEYDLGARLPVEAVRIVFPEANSVAAYEIATRDNEKAPWRTIATATFHRIVREGVELTSLPLSVGRRGERYWKLRPLAKSEGPPPELEVHWRPAEIVFVKKGEGPFTLAFADPQAKSEALPISSLMPSYERGAETKLPQAFPGNVQGAPPVTGLQKYMGEVSPKRVALWAVLVIAVLVLGFMAWRLQGQVKDDPK